MNHPILATPLGILGFHIELEGQTLDPIEAFNEPGLRSLKHYKAGPVRIDFTLAPIPSRYPVDVCYAANWRIWTARQAPAVLLRAEWDPGANIEDGGINSGEHLMALTWEAPCIQLSIGTRDEEVLPAAFEEARYWPHAVGEREGLQILVPPQPSGSMLQIQFLVAWKTGDFEEQDIATWLAVDATLTS